MLIRKAVLFFAVACVIAVGSVQIALAILIPGGGSKKTDCFIELDVTGVAAPVKNTVSCTDGDPACDNDGACNNSCDVKVRACLRQTDSSLPLCVPPTALTKASAKVKGPGGASLAVPALDSSTCGAFLDDFAVAVKTRRNKNKPDKTIVSSGKFKRKLDKDTLKFVCVPRSGPCPTTTTSTTVASTTTTTIAVCQDGVRGGNEECDDGNAVDTDACRNDCSAAACGDNVVRTGTEQCDPPGQGTCPGGQICNDSCQCVAASACTCGSPAPTLMQFTTGIPNRSIATGSVSPARCVQCEIPSECPTTCTTDLDCMGKGTCAGPLTAGGLYFGAGLVSVPLPAKVPDTGTSLIKTGCSGNTLFLSATTAAENSNLKCTSKNECFFGPPLPIPNNTPTGRPTSTCIVNVVAKNAAGRADCSTGETTELNLPLTSYVYLGGDLDGDPDNGAQPCPICDPNTLKCKFGERDGMDCTPGSTAFDDAYPTSQDCPLPLARRIGQLPIAFKLTTGTQSLTSFATGAQPRVFCGFCSDTSGGAPVFARPPVSCTADAECAGTHTGCGTIDGDTGCCTQQSAHNGAFGNSFATTITQTGSPAGTLSDGQPHDSTLISVFCIPPTYDAIIDPVADLPGPGAVSLRGTAQLLP